ncbi:MAG: PD-(D/E)XK nuclease family protein [Deferribacteraceae bacterium]|jgi:RecB family exonuclease|nr:PD-(D/E)XK nuclease family protein [Deferribacteraceae bacterium]
MISLAKAPSKKNPIPYFSKRISPFDSVRTAAIVQSNRNRRLLSSTSYWELDIFTVKEFLNAAAGTVGVLLPEPLRGYYMQKAVEALSERENRILFHTPLNASPTSYSDYLKRSSSLLPFFRELAAERIDSVLLAERSSYDDYAEQIKVLAAIWDNYSELIKKDGFIDVWQTYTDFETDEIFLSRYDTFFILISGGLSRFEIELYKRISEKRNLEIVFNFVGGRHPQERLFKDIFGAEIKREEGDTGIVWEKADRSKHSLILRYNVGEEDDENFYAPADPSEIEIYPASGGFSQYELITRRIFELHFDKQIPLNKMAVVLPSQELLVWFQRSDIYKLYHVSHMETVAGFGFLQFLASFSALLNGKNENGYPLVLLEKLSAYPFVLPLTDSGFFEKEKRDGKLYISLKDLSENRALAGLFSYISPLFDEVDTYSAVIQKLLTLLEKLSFAIKADADKNPGHSKRELAVMEDAVARLKQLGHVFSHINDEFPTAELLGLILTEIADVLERSSGKGVLVLELSESRNLQFDYLFISGMTASAFPAQLQNSLFLNSESRQALSLPSFADMNEFQKSSYYELIARAKKTLITYPSSEDVTPSPFISEITAKAKGWLDREKTFFPAPFVAFPRRRGRTKEYSPEIYKTPARLELLRRFRYSPTALDSFRRCQRRFYYEYIAKLRPPQTAVDSINMGELGNILHRIMRELFLRGFSPLSPEYPSQLYLAYDEQIAKYDYFTRDPVGVFYARNLRDTLERIAARDRKHSEEHSIIKQHFEERVEAEYGGISFAGRADRWDEGADGLYLVDYKFRSKDIKSASSRESFENPDVDIQLPFYALLLERKFGKLPVQLFWFDLKNSYEFKIGFNMELYEDFKNYFLTLANRIMSPGAFEIPENVNCRYCSFQAFCPGYVS